MLCCHCSRRCVQGCTLPHDADQQTGGTVNKQITPAQILCINSRNEAVIRTARNEAVIRTALINVDNKVLLRLTSACKKGVADVIASKAQLENTDTTKSLL